MDQQIKDISSKNYSELDEQSDQSDSVYGRELQSPIFGYRYQLPDLPKAHTSRITLDTSLSHIPVYTHLKVYDLKPVRQPRTPSILSALHRQLSEDIAPGRLSKGVPSAARMSEEDEISASHHVKKDNIKTE